MRLTASVVTYHSDDRELRQCLDSLSPEWFDHVWVIDNSRDSATESVCGDYDHVEYIGSDNRGYGAGHNQALRRTMSQRTDYHLVLNPDVRFEPRDIVPLIDYMTSHPECGCLQPRLVRADGSDLYSVRMLPTPWDLVLRRFIPGGLFSGRRARYELRDLPRDVARNVPYHQGSFMLLRVKALNETGMFDERFFMYPEDIDLTRRINARYTTMYVPLVKVVHNHRAASYRNIKMLKIHVVNMIKYFNKWGWIFDRDRKMRNRRIRAGEQ